MWNQMHAGASRAMVGAWDNSLEYRMNASAAGLLAVRIAAAVARIRSGSEINDRDRRAASTVADDFRREAGVLRGEWTPRVSDEAAYEVAGAALTAMSGQSRSAPTYQTDTDAATTLDSLATDLEALVTGDSLDAERLKRLETLFSRAGNLVHDSLGQSGEALDGIQQAAGRG